MAIAAQPLTLEEFLALPGEKPALGYAPDGRITQKVSPTMRHIRIALALGFELTVADLFAALRLA